MDSISSSIIAALTTGAQGEAPPEVSESYQQLRAVIRRRYGPDNEIYRAIENLEIRPLSAARRQTLAEEVEINQVNGNPDIVRHTQALLDALGDLVRPASYRQRAAAIAHVQEQDNWDEDEEWEEDEEEEWVDDDNIGNRI